MVSERRLADQYRDQRGGLRQIAPDTRLALERAIGVERPDAASLALAVGGQLADLWPDAVITGAITLEGGDLLPVAAVLPAGVHRFVGTIAGQARDVLLVVAPAPSPPPPRSWAVSAGTFQLVSSGSWGVGDLADVDDLVTILAAAGADALILNPVHAISVTGPYDPSPYYPTSRRYVSAFALRPEKLDEYSNLSAGDRAEVERLRHTVPGRSPLAIGDSHAARAAALRLIFDRCGQPTVDGDAELQTYATFQALAEQHGPDFRRWPARLRTPGEAALDAADPRSVAFHRWLAVEAAAAARRSAERARRLGMAVGIVWDMAVGVDPGGADVWASTGSYARGVSQGAPPDDYSPAGQDWQVAPWNPAALAATGAAEYRHVLRAMLSGGGGLRIDHVLGLVRSWWIPDGWACADGGYVLGEPQLLSAALRLEAARKGALLIGEDLGTVPDGVRELLAATGMLGCDVSVFAFDADTLPPPTWAREMAVASVTTHDLPTIAGWITGSTLALRERLGTLGADPTGERMRSDAHRRRLIAALGTDQPWPAALTLHRHLAESRALIACVGLADMVGQHDPVNIPGTIDEYPNWRIPLTDDQGRIVPLEELAEHPHVLDTISVMRAQRGSRGAPAAACGTVEA